jgi:hypothetical protein
MDDNNDNDERIIEDIIARSTNTVATYTNEECTNTVVLFSHTLSQPKYFFYVDLHVHLPQTRNPRIIVERYYKDIYHNIASRCAAQ